MGGGREGGRGGGERRKGCREGNQDEKTEEEETTKDTINKVFSLLEICMHSGPRAKSMYLRRGQLHMSIIDIPNCDRHIHIHTYIHHENRSCWQFSPCLLYYTHGVAGPKERK